MRSRSLVLLTVLTLHAGAALAASKAPAGSPLQRGAYLVRIMGCNDCHTPWKLGPNGPEPDMSRELSGHPEDVTVSTPLALGHDPWAWAGAQSMTAFTGPWGVSFTANLTPDPETGIGLWDEQTFVQAIRTGRHEGRGRPILPPMPWPQYRHATDEDLGAIFAYLRSIPPVRNRVPPPLDPPDGR